MTENAVVDLYGCSAGKSCAGKLFMQSLAENLFQGKNGTVISQNVVTVGIPEMESSSHVDSTGAIYISSRQTGRWLFKSGESFAYNQLDYPALTWNKLDSQGNYRDTVMTGLAESRLDEHQTIKDACLSGLSETIEGIHEAERSIAENGTCPSLGRGCRRLYRGFIDRTKSLLETYERDPVQEFEANDYQRLANHHLPLFDIHEMLMQCHEGAAISNYECQAYKVFRSTRAMEQQQGYRNNSNRQRTRGQR